VQEGRGIPELLLVSIADITGSVTNNIDYELSLPARQQPANVSQ
jgi:hypothetical protein